MGVEAQDVRLLDHRPPSLLLEWVYTVKVGAQALTESALPAREAGTLAAVLFGNQERLDARGWGL